MALSTSAFSLFNVLALKRIPEAFASNTARSISLIASRNLLEGEERRRYTFLLFWYVTTVSVSGTSLVGGGSVLGARLGPPQATLLWITIKDVTLVSITVFVVFFGVRICTVRSEPREKLIRESRVNCNEEKKLPEDCSVDSNKSRAVANQRRSVCFSITEMLIRKSSSKRNRRFQEKILFFRSPEVVKWYGSLSSLT